MVNLTHFMVAEREPVDPDRFLLDVSTNPEMFLRALEHVVGKEEVERFDSRLIKYYRNYNPGTSKSAFDSAARVLSPAYDSLKTPMDDDSVAASLEEMFGERWVIVRQLLASKDAVSVLMAFIEDGPNREGVIKLSLDEIEALELTCLSGEFRVGEAYAEHPTRAGHYLRMGTAHTSLREEKWQEFLHLAGSLGARTVSIIDDSSSESEARAQGEVNAGPFGGGSAEAGKLRTRIQGSSASVVFGEPLAPPLVPAPLYWRSSEPVWQSLIANRLNFWAEELNVSFRYQDELAVDASVAAKYQVVGASIGGSFKEAEEVSREYHVTFWPRSFYVERGLLEA